MKKRNNRLIILSIILIIAVIGGVVYRFSIKGGKTVSEIEKKFNIDEFQIDIQNAINLSTEFEKEISNLDKIENQSNLIAKIKVTDDRRAEAQEIKTKVIIEKIYKSTTTLKENEEIYMYEPIYIDTDFNIISSANGYNMMKTNNEYIVFLKYLNKDGMKYTNKERHMFLPVSAKYAVYPVSSENISIVNKDKLNTGECTYGTYKNSPILARNNKIKNTYLDLYDSVRKRYDI